MLKTLPWRVMAWGSSIGVLAGFLAVAFELVQGQICEYNQADEHEECTTYSLVPFLLIQVGKPLNDYGVAITALATVAIGFFTLTLKLSTDKLWEAGEKQRQLYEETAERQLRAYVGAAWGDVFIQDATHPFQIRPAITNYGLTPAYDVTFTGGAEVLNYPLPNDATLTYGRESKPWATLWPNAHNLGMIEMGRMLSVAEIDEIKSPVRKRLYAFGRLEYLDAFKRKRYTEFCFSIVWDQLGRAIGGETAGYHTKSN
jgi:hypothetical protein